MNKSAQFLDDSLNRSMNTTTLFTTNTTNTTTYCSAGACYENTKVVYWCFVGFSVITSLIAILGNTLVIYAGQQRGNRGRLKYLDGMVQSLAVTDLVYGLIGTPFNYVNHYLGP